MAINKNHQTHMDTMAAFEKADRNTPRDSLGRANYPMASNGMPRTPAQMASVKKAAKASAISRAERSSAPETVRSPAAPTTPGPAALTPASGKKQPGFDTGGLALNAKKGLLSL